MFNHRAAILLLLIASVAEAENAMPLAGTWRFALDHDNAGIEQRWFAQALRDQIKLPGSLQERGFGDRPGATTDWVSGIGKKLLSQPKYTPYINAGDFKTPFWLTPGRHYVGAAWYQRDVLIPDSWNGKRIILFLERPHWETHVWVDDRDAGSQNSLGVPHQYDLTDALGPGTHRLTIRVDNTMKVPVGGDAHSVSDQTQTDWNGIIGNLWLAAGEKLWIDDVEVYPYAAGKSVKLKIAIGNLTGAAGDGTISVSARSRDRFNSTTNQSLHWDSKGAQVEAKLDLGVEARAWDEFSPDVYHVNLQLNSAGKALNSRDVTFGLRDLGVSGMQFTINGRPIFLRGTLECCIFPLTGYPPTDVDSWKSVLQIAREHGLNHLRFHSWCPPEAAFVAADEMGFYYQVECSCWALFGDGAAVDQWVYDEAGRMLRTYGNHPSFILMAATNEAAGKNRDAFLGKWVEHFRHADPRRKYTAGSGWPQVPQNDYHVMQTQRMHQSKELARPPQTQSDYRAIVANDHVPLITHEMGQWCAYPNFGETGKYTGSLQPGSLLIFKDLLERAGMGEQARDFLMASGAFQTALYKAEIEEQLRTPGVAGFQLLDLHDFPGQGFAPVGVLDAFWESKPYATPRQYRRFCNQTVVLARMGSRVFANDRACEADVEVAHFGPTDLADCEATWALRGTGGKTLREGQLQAKTIRTGGVTALGRITIPFISIEEATKLNLEISLDKTEIANDWDLWVYPASIATAAPSGISIIHDLDNNAVASLQAGGKALLLIDPSHVTGDTLGGFEPIFWNRVTFPNQRQHTLGVLCDPRHPAFASFPTDPHSNWQWWDIQQFCKPMVLDALPRQIKPIIQLIDDWNMCRKLALAFEVKVGGGKLLVCSIDLTHDLDHRLAARQLRRSLLDYMVTETFAPTVSVTPEQIRAVIQP